MVFCSLKDNNSGKFTKFEKQFCTKTALTVVIQVFVPIWQLRNIGLEKLGLVHKDSAHPELFPRNADISGFAVSPPGGA